MPQTVLIIDDEPELVRLLDYNLTKAGYLALTTRDGESGLAAARRHAPDLVVLDVMMPGLDGREVLRRLRADPGTARIPVLMLTAKAAEEDRVIGLEMGADDYVAKPFGMRELLARIKAVLRRKEMAGEAAEIVRAGKIIVDSGRRLVTVEGKPVSLTLTEFNLLNVLAQRRGRALSRDELLSLARGDDAPVVDRAVDVHVASLRRKLGKHGEMIETVRGVGYRLRD